MKIIQIKINKSIPGYPSGATARVQADDAGVPIEKSWRDRLRDAKVDSCVEVIRQDPPEPKSKTLNKDKEKS